LALADPPTHLVFHFDILNVLVRLINHPVFMEDMPMDLKVLQPREPEDLVDKETSNAWPVITSTNHFSITTWC
jgi:hypothetical protein